VDDERRRPRPLANTEIIDEAAQGSEPDVEVFHLSGDELDLPQEQPSKRRKWVEDARTTVWEGEPPPEQSVRRSQPAALQSSSNQSLSVHVDPRLSAERSARRSRQGWAEDVPYEEVDQGYSGQGQPLQIEAPVRVKVKSVARISPDHRLWLMTRPDSIPAEQFRVLALKLREERGARVVAVASPTRQGEGHLAAVNLALAFAEGGRSRTVLLDADLRGSEVGGLFDLGEGPNLADQIRQHRRHPEQDWITLGLSTTLHYLPAGPSEKNPASLLSSEVMADLMVEMRRFFDFIVVVTPAVMDSADVNILQEHVDGVLLVARSGVTRRDSLAASIKRLGHSRFLGTVLVDTKR